MAASSVGGSGVHGVLFTHHDSSEVTGNAEVVWIGTLHAEKPKPVTLQLGWNELLAVVIIGVTALALDFLAYRASELKKRRQQAEQQHPQDEQGLNERQSISSTDNDGYISLASATSGHTLDTTTTPAQCSGDDDTSCTDSRVSHESSCNGHGDNGAKGGVIEVEVRPVSRAGVDGVAQCKSQVQIKRVCVLATWILCALVFHRMGCTMLARLSAVMGSLVAYLPHLLLSSKYRRDFTLGCVLEKSDKRRSVTDMLVWTSLVYVVPSVYGLCAHQYGIAFLQLCTTAGSTLFHLTRETKYFNLDNVFATSLLLSTAWALLLAARSGIWWYVVVIGLGGPFAIFCLVRCGMPGLVCCHPSGRGLCRKSNPEYDFFHMLWHLSSGLGTLVTIHFFEVHFPAEEAGGGWFHYFPDIPVVPTVSLTVSAMINLYGNRVGLMPLA